jgi:hypothetical protein
MKANRERKSAKGLKAATKLGVQQSLSKVPYMRYTMTNVSIHSAS